MYPVFFFLFTSEKSIEDSRVRRHEKQSIREWLYKIDKLEVTNKTKGSFIHHPCLSFYLSEFVDKEFLLVSVLKILRHHSGG